MSESDESDCDDSDSNVGFLKRNKSLKKIPQYIIQAPYDQDQIIGMNLYPIHPSFYKKNKWWKGRYHSVNMTQEARKHEEVYKKKQVKKLRQQ